MAVATRGSSWPRARSATRMRSPAGAARWTPTSGSASMTTSWLAPPASGWYAWPGESNGLSSSRVRDDVVVPTCRPPARPCSTPAPSHHRSGRRLGLPRPGRRRSRHHGAAAGRGRQALAVTIRPMPRVWPTIDCASGPATRAARYGVTTGSSRGLFLGARRIYSPQTTCSSTPHRGAPLDPFRLAPADVDFVADWRATVADRLPAGSSFVTQMAFNGTGTDAGNYPEQAVIAALRARQTSSSGSITPDHVNMNSMSVSGPRRSAPAATWPRLGHERLLCAVMVTPRSPASTAPTRWRASSPPASAWSSPTPRSPKRSTPTTGQRAGPQRRRVNPFRPSCTRCRATRPHVLQLHHRRPAGRPVQLHLPNEPAAT